MLSADDQCKAPAGDDISLPELSHEDLSLFLAFLYTGAFFSNDGGPEERQLHALLVAANKYDVPFLPGAGGAPQRAADAGGGGAQLQRRAQGAGHGDGGGARRAGGVLRGVP